MKTFSYLTIAAAIAASISAPALAQVPLAPAAIPNGPPLYGYVPSPVPGPLMPTPFSNSPFATGGGSFGYNVDVLRDNGF